MNKIYWTLQSTPNKLVNLFKHENYFCLKVKLWIFISLSITYNLMTLREVRNFNLRSFSVDIFSVFLSTSISGHPRFDLSHFWWHWRPIFGFREKRKSRQVGRPVMCHLIILLHSSPHLSYYILTCFNLFPINEIMFSKQILYKRKLLMYRSHYHFLKYVNIDFKVSLFYLLLKF